MNEVGGKFEIHHMPSDRQPATRACQSAIISHVNGYLLKSIGVKSTNSYAELKSI